MQYDPHDPATWIVELWWPPRWHAHYYASEFDYYRAFGLRLLREPGPWRVRLVAPDPVASYCEVAFQGTKVAEVHINSDVRDDEPWRYHAYLSDMGLEIDTADIEEVIRFLIQSCRPYHSA